MLVIGRALMSAPGSSLLDEPSLGLAPCFVEEIFQMSAAQPRAAAHRALVEQNAAQALAIADHGYVMETGRIVLEGSADQLRDTRTSRSSTSG